MISAKFRSLDYSWLIKYGYLIRVSNIMLEVVGGGLALPPSYCVDISSDLWHFGHVTYIIALLCYINQKFQFTVIGQPKSQNSNYIL